MPREPRLALHALGPDYDCERALADGSLDIFIGNWPELPPQLHLSPLLDDELVCVMAETNPLARARLEHYRHAEPAFRFQLDGPPGSR